MDHVAEVPLSAATPSAPPPPPPPPPPPAAPPSQVGLPGHSGEVATAGAHVLLRLLPPREVVQLPGHVEGRLLPAQDVVDDAVLLGLQGGHVPVAVRVQLDLALRLARVARHDAVDVH